MSDKEMILQMLSQMERIGDRQSEMLVKQTELSTNQQHMSESVCEIKEDISDIKEVQEKHGTAISEIQATLSANRPFKELAKEFAFNHPIISFAIICMLINMVLGSIGLPVISIKEVIAALGGG
jgi:hypothetical protein